MKCSICMKEIPTKHGWSDGNNAQPINDGRCCDECDSYVVIPTRLRQLTMNPDRAIAIGRMAHTRPPENVGAWLMEEMEKEVNP